MNSKLCQDLTLAKNKTKTNCARIRGNQDGHLGTRIIILGGLWVRNSVHFRYDGCNSFSCNRIFICLIPKEMQFKHTTVNVYDSRERQLAPKSGHSVSD